MLEFIISNYIIFIVIAIVLLLGLFGYMMDRKKYNDYRKEILETENILDSKPDIQSVQTPINVDSIQEKN